MQWKNYHQKRINTLIIKWMNNVRKGGDHHQSSSPATKKCLKIMNVRNLVEIKMIRGDEIPTEIEIESIMIVTRETSTNEARTQRMIKSSSLSNQSLFQRSK